MAIFNLTDIKFNKSSTTEFTKLNDVFNEDRFTIYRYPIELGNDPDRLNYIVFFINSQKNTQFEKNFVPESTTSALNRKNLTAPGARGPITPVGVIQEGIGNVKTAIANSTTASSASDTAAKLLGSTAEFVKKNAPIITNNLSKIGESLEESNFLRTTQRTNEMIALYMPNTISVGMSQDWGSVNLSEITGGFGSLLAGAKQIGSEGMNANLTPFIGDLLAKIPNKAGIDFSKAGQVLQAAVGYANNPQVEVIYQTPSLREYNFEFAFYPRSKQEAQSVQKIIELFRFHASPEIAANFGGKFLIPPSNFDVEFHFNGKENPNIPKKTTSVLTSVNVNYFTGSNYEIPLDNSIEDPSIGGSGMPYQIQLSLAFREIEIITKELIRGLSNNPKSGNF